MKAVRFATIPVQDLRICFLMWCAIVQDLKTIKQIFHRNLRALRGERTQAEIAEAARIPYRTYVESERSVIPQGPTLAAIAKVYGVSEVALFQDPEAQLELAKSIAEHDIKECTRRVSEFVRLKTEIAEADEFLERVTDKQKKEGA